MVFFVDPNREVFHMKRPFNFRTVLAFLAMAVLAACAQLGLQKPQSAEDSLQYARSIASGVYKTIGDLKAQNQITTEQGNAYFRQAETFENTLNTAAPLLANRPADAQAMVNTALAGLLALRDELAKRTPPK